MQLVQLHFGGESFGKVYGIGIGVFAIGAGVAQYPTMQLVMESGERGNFAGIDLAMVVVGAAMFAFPAFVYWRLALGKRKGENVKSNAV
jgi:hypothetical protein